MEFILDENVSKKVHIELSSHGYTCKSIREFIPAGSDDMLVAKVAENRNAILVSHDGDFKAISPKIPDGQKTRFRKLSRIHLNCKEFDAQKRVKAAISLISHEYEIALKANDPRMHLVIGASYLKSSR